MVIKEATCIRDWPSHLVKKGDVCKYYTYIGSGFIIQFPKIGFTLVGERKAKRYFGL